MPASAVFPRPAATLQEGGWAQSRGPTCCTSHGGIPALPQRRDVPRARDRQRGGGVGRDRPHLRGEVFERYTGVDPSLNPWSIHASGPDRRRLDRLPFPEPAYGPWRRVVEPAAERIMPGIRWTCASRQRTRKSPSARPCGCTRCTGAPYVADYRDAWSFDVFSGEPAARTALPQRRCEARLLARATEVWFVNAPIMARYAREHPQQAGCGPVPKARVRETYNSFDVLLLLLGAGTYVISGKVYEYLATGLPAVSVHPPANARLRRPSRLPPLVPLASLEPEDLAGGPRDRRGRRPRGGRGGQGRGRTLRSSLPAGAQLTPRVAELPSLVTDGVAVGAGSCAAGNSPPEARGSVCRGRVEESRAVTACACTLPGWTALTWNACAPAWPPLWPRSEAASVRVRSPWPRRWPRPWSPASI